MTVLEHVKSMAFGANTFPLSYGFAERFAGEGGHIATLPEIISARAKSPVNGQFWNTWFTTNSAEYIGLSATGIPIIIVAHGVGPLSTLEGIVEAYRPRKLGSDGRPDDNGEGHITLEEFRLLESGHYGEVEIIEASKVMAVYPGDDYTEPINLGLAERDPLLRARMGKDWRTVLEMMEKESYASNEYKGTTPLVISNETKLYYWDREWRDHLGWPMANLLVVARPANHISMRSENCYFDIGVGDRSGFDRFIGVRPGGDVAETHEGPSVLSDRKDALIVAAEGPGSDATFFTLKQIGGNWFTQVPKVEGESLETGWPEYPVTSIEVFKKRGQAIEFDSYFFFRYDIEQVKAQAPEGANAYYLSSSPVMTKIDGKSAAVAGVAFCKVTVDKTRRAVSEEQLDEDYDLQMQLLERFELANSA